MKNKLFTLLVLASSLYAEFSGSIQVTGTNHTSKPIGSSFHVNDKDIRAVATLDYTYEYENFDFDVRVSNKLYDTYLEQLSAMYAVRNGNNVYKIELGTVDTHQGVFSESYLATEQSPFIFKNHGMYNDEFLAGWLDTTVGTQLTYQYLQNCKYLYTIQFTYSRARELSKSRAEGAFYGFESQYLDLDFSHPIRSVDVKFEYLNTLTIFGNAVEMEVHPKSTGVGPSDKTAQYMQYLQEGDKSIFVPNTPYEIEVLRGGAIYENEYIKFSIEGFQMVVINEDIDLDYTTYGSAAYLAYYVTDALTFYTSYGESTNTRSDRRYEDIVGGFRYFIKENVAVLGEVKETNWIQHKTHAEHTQYLDQDDRDITVAALQLIVSF